MKCPHCGKEISRTQMATGLGSLTSEAKAAAAIENGKLGGRPITKPRKRKRRAL